MKIFILYSFFELVLSWSEVWALLIPLFIWLFVRKEQPKFLKPVIIYVWIALFINLLADLIGEFKMHLPPWLQSNNPLYNVHSVARFTCFNFFFIFFKNKKVSPFKKLLISLFILFICINFLFFENFLNPSHLSGSLLAVEAYLLLIYCMQYYLFQLRHEVENISGKKDFWVVTGLSIYVVVNFFLFLFYVPMVKEQPALAAKMWDVYNISYIIFCILIAKAFYVPDNN